MTGSASVGLVYVLAFVLGVSAALDNPARQALLGQLVGRELLSNAVGLNSATFNLSRIIGPALAGLTIAAVGVGPVFVINALSTCSPLGTLVMLRPRTAEGRSGPLPAAPRCVRPRLSPNPARLGDRARPRILRGNLRLQLPDHHSHDGPTRIRGSVPLLTVYWARCSPIGSILGSLLAARRTTPRLRFVLRAGFGSPLSQDGRLMPTYLSFLFFPPARCGLTLLTFRCRHRATCRWVRTADSGVG